ncbi:MAG: methylmalonyl-CoA carboxyltransferase [Myxococcales bacterium]|nr:methylmalonyl-CoA carboxyltransferase [Myxococcales bacterium]
MPSVEDRIRELEARERAERAMGGEKAIEKQHKEGKLTARERIELLFDPGSFTELDLFVRHRCTQFGMDKTDIPADGVVTGHGRIDGRRVFAYAQDFTARAGTMAEMQSKKICKVMDLALKTGAPFVGLADSGGARIQEGVDALSGYGQIFYRNSLASGVIPQLSGIMGPTAGGAVYSPAMTDFVFMVKNVSYMFITGPEVIKSVTGEEVSFEALGGAMAHCQKSGCAHFACEDDRDCLHKIRTLLSYLPSNNLSEPPRLESGDDPARAVPELDRVIPDDPRAGYDMRAVIRAIADQNDFFEPHELYAPNILVGFIRLDGYPVGVIANQPQVMAGCLDVNASDKATRFIRFCDAFNIPLLTLTDVPGYLPGTDQEWAGIIRHGAKLLWCYSEATVPKVTLITRKAYGGAYLAMCSSDLGADCVMAWPTAEIAVMGAEGASRIIFRKEIESAADRAAKFQEKVTEYQKAFYHPYLAASRGFLSAVIAPRDSRARIVEAFEMLRQKRELRPTRKHGNIPM